MIKHKRVFLHVFGEDFSAMRFEQNYNAQEVYNQMIKDGVTQKTIETDDYIVIKIVEFGQIDDKFITFMKDQLCDYDQLKGEDIYEVEPHDWLGALKKKIVPITPFIVQVPASGNKYMITKDSLGFYVTANVETGEIYEGSRMGDDEVFNIIHCGMWQVVEGKYET